MDQTFEEAAAEIQKLRDQGLLLPSNVSSFSDEDDSDWDYEADDNSWGTARWT